MALGGGIWQAQNKILPGAYINFVSASRGAAVLSDRGVAAMPLELDWGPEGEIFTVTAADFQQHAEEIFGYPYSHNKLKGLRDLFQNIRTGYFYRLGTGAKASNSYATAKYAGLRGNDIKIVIAKNVDDVTKFDVSTVLDGHIFETQTVTSADGLKDNAFISWKKGTALSPTAATPLTGGANATAITGEDYQAFLDRIEPYSFNTLGCVSTDKTVKNLLAAFTRRMRDEQGVKFQTVLFQPEAPDYEGIIGVENAVTDEDCPQSAAVYWTTGAQAGCAVNRSVQNMRYTGEFSIDVSFTQAQLTAALQTGKFVFHRVGDEIRVLDDINTLTTFTEAKREDFASNQTIRVLDQIGNDIAVLFGTKYLGQIPNDNAGRISFWSDVVTIHEQLLALRAIENFSSDDIKVDLGSSKKSVVCTDAVSPVNAMSKLYMTVTVN